MNPLSGRSAAPSILGLLFPLSFIGDASAQRPEKLSPSSVVHVAVKEPSDLAWVPGTDPARFLVVSDNGYVAEMRADGSVKRRTGEIAFDLEGALLHEGTLIVVDERTRRLLWLDTTDLRVLRRLTIPHGGGRNKGYEAIAWNPVKERFLLITERDPIRVVELDSEFRVVNEIEIDRETLGRGVRDISSATWHDGHLWLLSDMDMLLLKCDPNDYRVLERWTVPVINPEGLAFGGDGTLYILSDDRQRLYTFPFPPARAAR